MNHVVVAPDKFKGGLTARQVAEHVAAGLRRAVPDLDVRLAPVADGGEGTVEAVLSRGFHPVPRTVPAPTGEPVEAVLAVRDTVAVVELAQASGLHALPGGRAEPLQASSRGTGELVRAALDSGCGDVVLGLVDIEALLPGARLVLTGEGSLDVQSLHGKVPVGVARAAARHGVPIVAVAGRSLLTDEEVRRGGLEAGYALTDLEPDVERCIVDAGSLLERLACVVGEEWLPRR